MINLDYLISTHTFKKFEESEKSSFSYWYYHWKAFNLTAYYLGVWKLKYLFHDFEKPWLKLFWEYSKVQKWHREHNAHHVQYKKGYAKIDWEALVIDNECSRFTKISSPLNAREYFYYVINEKENVPMELRRLYSYKGYTMIDKLGL